MERPDAQDARREQVAEKSVSDSGEKNMCSSPRNRSASARAAVSTKRRMTRRRKLSSRLCGSWKRDLQDWQIS